MLSLEKMQKIRVIAPRDNLQKAIDSLYSFGAIQVQECKTAGLDLPLAQFEEISSMLIRLRAEERSLSLKGSPKFKEANFSEIRKNYAELAIADLDSKRKMLSDLETKISELESQKAALLPFRKLNFNPQESKSSGVLLSYFEPRPKSEKQLQNALSKIPSDTLRVLDDGKNYMLLAYDVRQAEKVAAIISKYSFAILPIPQIKGGFKEELKSIEKKIFELQIEIREIREWLADYVKHKGTMLLKIKEQLKVASLKAELPFKIGKTENFSVVEGWIESRNFDDFESSLEKLGAFLLEKVETKETPPSKLNNPKLIRPFEFMVEFFSLPKSFEIDPTFFISITFPLFFGMIMGDIGYGMLALFAALAIKLKSKADLMKRIGGMLALSAVSAIFFGVIFGEFFGLEHIFGIELHPLVHRAKEVEELINISLLLGVLHLSLGFIIGAFTQFSNGHKKHAAAKISWLVVEICLILSIINLADVSLLHIFEPLKQFIGLAPSLVGLLAGMIGIALFESPTHLMELPSLLSNILSYLRIAALGLSGVIISMIINQLPVDFDGFFAMVSFQRPFDMGLLISFVLFGGMLILGHLVALGLAILESGVQSLRLHYVEFFSKFYEGGGLPFVPLRKKEE
ncbi:hypothetical protein HY989_01650 [Candidatus Micrarchaeota archaeon]|nr:hypothetical protein [Candidatus Micrarchaeota archaeon]